MNESLQWIREHWTAIPPIYRIVGGLIVVWGAVFVFYGRKWVN